jgi:hypothetical protein
LALDQFENLIHVDAVEGSRTGVMSRMVRGGRTGAAQCRCSLGGAIAS